MRALLLLVVAGCGAAPLPGAPKIGSPCTTESPECATAMSLATCDTSTGRWFEESCMDRCSNTQTPKCALARADGEACRGDAEGKVGGCRTPSSISKCSGGKWTTCTCSSCREESFGVVCSGMQCP